jgi:hypothetical protein
MAKRQRGSRPGQRPPSQRGSRPSRPAAPAPAARPSGSLTDDELQRAAELEARIVAEERAAVDARPRGRDRRRFATEDEGPRSRTRLTGTLAAVATEEYKYVARDLRRISIVFAAIFGLLLVLFVLIEVAGIVKV